MRRVVLAAIAFAFGGAGLASADPTPAVQLVEGVVVAPTRTPVSPLYTSGGAIQRMVYTATGINKVFGFTYQVDPATWGGRFDLEVVSGVTGREDVDIGFYVDLATVSGSGFSITRAVGGETGFVPYGTRTAHVILFDGARARFRYQAFAPEAPPPPPPPDAAPLPAPGIHPDFGKGDSPLAATLRARPHVVIALVDTGVNPYHRAFRRYEYGVHPSEYIEGFPVDTPALGLTLGDPDYMNARAFDDATVWSQVQERTLYWIPGTNIVGARAEYDWSEGEPLPDDIAASRLILDDNGHGTAVASVATGGAPRQEAAAFGSNPEALIVVVEGPSYQAIQWISEQPWIDFISASYGPLYPLPYDHRSEGITKRLPQQVRNQLGYGYREPEFTAPFVLRDGRTACFAAGNGFSGAAIAPDRSPSITPMSGPSWVISVGAASPHNGQDYWWHSVPADVSSYGLWWPAAAQHSTDGTQSFAGTSNATPLTCGVFSKALLESRRSLGDAGEGIHVTSSGLRVPALGPAGIAGGLLADGILERAELEAAVLKTAFPRPVDPFTYGRDPWVIPDNPLIFTMEGYGIADVASAERAISVILGTTAMPDRSEVDAWIAAVDAVRDIVYPPNRYLN